MFCSMREKSGVSQKEIKQASFSGSAHTLVGGIRAQMIPAEQDRWRHNGVNNTYTGMTPSFSSQAVHLG